MVYKVIKMIENYRTQKGIEKSVGTYDDVVYYDSETRRGMSVGRPDDAPGLQGSRALRVLVST